MMKSNQKCVRLSDRTVRYIEAYRGDNFSQKLENYVLDTEERREQLVLEWNRLQAEIQDKQRELAILRGKVLKTSQVDQRFGSLVSALRELLET